MARDYEMMVVLHPDVSGDAVDERMGQLRSLLTEHGNTVEEIIDWGRRRLAYPIRQSFEGHYLIAHYAAEPEADSKELERALQIDDGVLRHLIVKREE